MHDGTHVQLAIDGGIPVRRRPPPPWPFFARDEIDAVTQVLESGQVNQWTGHFVDEFQNSFSKLFDGANCVAVSNGSLAIEIALRALGVGPGDEVIVPARSFVATASSVTLVGATPVFADVDFDTQLLSVATIEPHLRPSTKAILPVHLNGRSCDMTSIMRLADKHGLVVLEDCAQSIGSTWNGQRTGTFGHAAAFSFCQDKIITTGGEGGMILTADSAVWAKSWSLKDHGKSHALAFAPAEPRYRWIHESAGTNARMTEMQAVLGCKQLPKLDVWISARNKNAAILGAVLGKYPFVRIASMPANQVHAYYRLEFTVDTTMLNKGWGRDRIVAAMIAEGIPCSVGTCPEIYREGLYANSGAYPTLPNARRLGEESIVLLTHPTIDAEFMGECEQAIEKVFGAASA